MTPIPAPTPKPFFRTLKVLGKYSWEVDFEQFRSKTAYERRKTALRAQNRKFEVI